MPESRDRLSRPDDVAERYIRRLRSLGRTGVLHDDVAETGSATVPFRWGTTPLTGTRGPMGVAPPLRAVVGGVAGPGRGGASRFGGNGRGRSSNRALAGGRENTPAAGRVQRAGRGGSVLPSWYPRRPLHDVTPVVRVENTIMFDFWYGRRGLFHGNIGQDKAIERRRARLRETEGQQLESPLPQDHRAHYPSMHTPAAHLEHDFSMISPNPTIKLRTGPASVGKVPKILLDVTNQNAGDSDFLTPQKRLLNSIDTVGKVVMEELRKLERTPTAKKAEREKRVRTLMSMR
ncbi:hypothetical protein RJ639_017443 [Escallonia herrerae]|uniref:Protein POLYCHOME n=1 Tax=Escallonia herrerae TaxID=1293975 RepID=A0AA88VCZ8_9ASTE|nr:hypothetical protein RJ639_017443 [Escallonia herrerae]